MCMGVIDEEGRALEPGDKLVCLSPCLWLGHSYKKVPHGDFVFVF